MTCYELSGGAGAVPQTAGGPCAAADVRSLAGSERGVGRGAGGARLRQRAPCASAVGQHSELSGGAGAVPQTAGGPCAAADVRSLTGPEHAIRGGAGGARLWQRAPCAAPGENRPN